MSEKQIFITGCYKSGTDYITQLIGNHPKVSSIFDVNFLRYCLDRFDPPNERYRDVFVCMDKFLKKRFRLTLDVPSLTRKCQGLDFVNYWNLYDLIMSDLCLEKNETIWADKSHLSWRLIPRFLDNFYDGKAIIIIRNPKAVLASFKTHTYAEFPLHLGAIFNWYDSMKYAETYSRLYSKRFKLIRYEDILYKAEDTLKSLFKFLGLSSDHDLLDSSNWKDPSGKEWKYNTSYTNESFDPHKSAKKWETVLKSWEKSMCDKINKEYYAINGYEPAYIDENIDLPEGVLENKVIVRYMKDWLFRGVGIEEFPTDPTDPKNWSEDRKGG